MNPERCNHYECPHIFDPENFDCDMCYENEYNNVYYEGDIDE